MSNEKNNFNASLSLDESIRIPQTWWTTHSTRTTHDQLQKLSHLQLCPDSLTHIDLANAYIDSPCLTKYKDKTPSQRRELAKEHAKVFRRPFTIDCVILNLLEKQWWMENILREAVAKQGVQGRLPLRPDHLWSEEEYNYILEEIKIDANKIEKLLKGYELKDVCVTLFTGWRAFTPLYRDCSHPYWWAWHPFLLHPYLTKEAGDLLFEQGVRGVATDAVSIDSPLRHWASWVDINPPWGPTRIALDNLKKDMDKYEEIEVFLPIHNIFLSSSNGFIIESLSLKSDILYLEREQEFFPQFDEHGVKLPDATQAQMTVLPFFHGSESESLMTCTLIFPPRSHKND